ncbi:hypothetical protein ACTNDN_21190 [Niallia sp. HCP3S3_B10]
MEEANTLHEQISTYMINKGYYHPEKQAQMDINTVETALNLVNH